MKTVLVTGGCGFIGSNFIRYMLNNHPDYLVINADALTYAGNPENLKDLEDNANYKFFKTDIRNRYMVEQIFAFFAIDYVVNFVAESHVDRSIIEPDVLLTTNIIGTQVLLNAAKKQWKLKPEDKYDRGYKEGVRFHQISTGQVYGSADEGKFTEESILKPSSPYSASKASADMLAMAYNKTYGMPVTISRSSNNFGPYQFPQKFIPLIIISCMYDKPIPVYGDGLQLRDWIHVNDHSKAIDLILHLGKDGDIYNIGGGNEKANIDIVKHIVHSLEKSEDLIKYIRDSQGYDRCYAIDSTKIETELNWSAEYSFEQGMEECIGWYLDNMGWVERIVSGEYKKYIETMYG